MNSGLAALARRASHARQALVLRGGGGGPLGRPQPPTQPLAEQDELLWDDGTANPEPALDQFNMVSPQTALKWLVGGLSVYATVGYLFAADPPEVRTPWAPKQNVGIPAEVGASASG